MNHLKLSLFFVLVMNSFGVISMQGLMRELAREAIEEARQTVCLQQELKRQKKVVTAAKQHYGLTEQIDTKDPIDHKIKFLTQVLAISDSALPQIEKKETRSNRIQEKSNLGTLLQYAIIDVCDEGVRTDPYLNQVLRNKKSIENYQETCCCMPWCAEGVATNFVQASHQQVVSRLEILKCKASLHSKKSVVQQLEISSSSNVIIEEERI